MDPIQLCTPKHFSRFLEALERVRRTPGDDSLWTTATNEGLQWIVDHLLLDEIPLGPETGHGHLYCAKGFRIGAVSNGHVQQHVTTITAQTMTDIRSFLLRLISYKPKGLVSTWRNAFEDCLQMCPDCALGLEAAIAVLADRWLPLKFSDQVVASFITGIRKALTNLCIKKMIFRQESAAAVDLASDSVSHSVSLEKLRPGVLALILSRPGVLLHQEVWPKISRAMAHHSVTQLLPNRCLDFFLPGLILLAMSSDDSCANSARASLHQLSGSKTQTKAVDPNITPAIQEALREAIGMIDRDVINSQPVGFPLLASSLAQHPTRQNSWRSLLSILKAIPHSAGSTPSLFFEFKKLITSHLGDHGNHITTVLECFGVLLRLLNKSFWEDSKGPDSTALENLHNPLPHQAFSQILINNSFTDSLSHPGSADACAFWLIPLICSAVSAEESLATIFTQLHQMLLCELQDEKFELQVRIHAIEIALIPWATIVFPTSATTDFQSLKPSSATALSPLPSPLHHSFDSPKLFQRVSCIIRKRGLLALSLQSFFDVAYRDRYCSTEWDAARTKAHCLIEHITLADANTLATAVQKMGRARSQLEDRTTSSAIDDIMAMPVEITTSLWTLLYQTSNANLPPRVLVRLYSLLIRAVSRCAHVDHLASKSWLPNGRTELLPIKPAWEALNTACESIRAPLVDKLLDLSESTTGSEVTALVMDDKGVMQALIVLILSPHDGLHLSALSLVRQWSDCTSRLDCLRFLLSKGMATVFEGLLISLITTDLHTKLLPDAMSLARRFVRCMTDVLEILCSRSEGLFSDMEFMQNIDRKKVVQLWNMMCSAVSNIFQRTPHWSQFWATAEMTDWMRDALIFSEQLVHQFHAFEDACTVSDSTPVQPAISKSKSDDPVRQQMVDSFMRPTEAILSWLRLTEPDLLDRSTNVLVTMLEKLAKFRRPLKPTIVEKLEKYLDRNRQHQLTAKQKSVGVVLTEQQCGNIKKALASHPDLAERFGYASDDDDIAAATILDELIIQEHEQVASQKAAWSHMLDGNKKGASTKSTASTSTSAPRTERAPDFKSRGSAGSSSIKLDLSSHTTKPKPGKSHGKSVAGSSSGLLDSVRKGLKASRPPFARTVGKQAAGPSTERILPSSRSSLPPAIIPSIAKSFHPNLGWVKPQAGIQQRTSAEGRDLSASDDSDISEEDKASDTGLAALAKAQKPKIAKPRKVVEQRRIKMFNDPTLEKYQKLVQVKQQKQAQMKLEKLRMSPDFTTLHRHILQWDYSHSGECPPNSPAHFNHLPPSFENFSHYLRSLEPLLMCECWQQICQAKEAVAAGEKTPIPCEVTGRTSVDDFVEIYTTIKHGMLPDRIFFTEADLVLFRAIGKPASHCVMAKVINLSRKPESFELNLRMHFGAVNPEVSGFLVPKTKWEVLHLCSLSTTHREWAALRSLPYLTLADDILEARVTTPAHITEEQLSKVMQCQKVNEPQGRAIISSLATPGFSLIQGPPGTGKTSTIVGLIGAFIASRPKVSTNSDDTQSITRKILLCAPSNAAVDEVAKRLKDGVRGAEGELIIPKLVRIGADSKVNIAVKDIFIDELVEAQSHKLESNKAGESVSGVASRVQELRQQIIELREVRNCKQLEAEQVSTASPLFAALHQEAAKARRKIHELSQQLDEARDQQAASKRYLDAATRRLRMQILQDADVVCSTLSGSGHDYMSQLPFGFETVVIDEACQCVEPASLIPLRYNATQCILVGGDYVLYHYVFPTLSLKYICDARSTSITAHGALSNCFKSRIRSKLICPYAAVCSGSRPPVEYRMHPFISAFPSDAFYESRLMDGPNMASKTAQPWHSEDSLFPPYAFYHPINAREERGRHHSFINRVEAGLAVAIYSRLTKTYPEIDFAYRVGIITAYAGQVGELRRQFRQAFHPDVVATIDINTVDGFQGQEKDIIILSCVRGGMDDDRQGSGIGFLKDTRRMNVALTRAKSSLFVLGNQVALVRDKNWKALIDDARARGHFTEVSIDTFNSAPSVRSTAKSRPSAKPTLKKVAVLLNEDDGQGLMTPQQLSQQSKARGQAAGIESTLKRKTSTDPNSAIAEITKKTRTSDADDVEKHLDAAPLSAVEGNDPTSNSRMSFQEANISSRHLDNKTRPDTPATHPPTVGPSSHRPVAPVRSRAPTQPTKKGPRPSRISTPQEGATADTRNVKQRLQDEMKVIRKPAP
ncbi:hypothetical protein CROQUDRAFT_137137 [Cronartium quercuum f. sp. fusiforme G11]|uniref:Uncharacterized protein n=1 Tax=Cronartium quercuum f. sp. fusiforme G11 TaxID=708437 RepID=A0A9P6N8N3_9BASI|nr:hypothetical protein CROQUDRAFT_137137 [Cronartium quercuum f. sp. fusiforme G11]